MLKHIFFILIGSFAFSPVGHAVVSSGYTDDVATERDQRFVEIFLFVAPPPQPTNLSNVIFNEPLSKEFRAKYREKFGNIDTESVVYQDPRYRSTTDSSTTPNTTEKSEQDRRQFADFMMKRLSEWHMDNYFKNEPSVRPIYEVKEKISHVEVKVAKEVKVNLQYSLSGNTMDVLLDNPWCDSKVQLQMNPATFGPSQIQETTLLVGKQVSSRTRVNTKALVTDSVGTVELVQAIGTVWTSSFGVTSPFTDRGITQRENRLSLGLGRGF